MVAVCELQAGDHVRVASGDAVPVDGTLLQAPALLDESLLSGESQSVAKRIGDVVYAGSTALEAPLPAREKSSTKKKRGPQPRYVGPRKTAA